MLDKFNINQISKQQQHGLKGGVATGPYKVARATTTKKERGGYNVGDMDLVST